MSSGPLYSFSSIGSVSVFVGTAPGLTLFGVEIDRSVVSFDYVDSRDGTLYHVEATGYRAKKESIIANKN